jgi:hypothetical protein
MLSEQSAGMIVMMLVNQQSLDSQTQTDVMPYEGLGFTASNISLGLGDCDHWRGGVSQS